MAEELNGDDKITDSNLKVVENSTESQNNSQTIINTIDEKSQKKVDDNSNNLNQKEENMSKDANDDQCANMKEEIHSQIINEFKKLKKETGYTSEELLELLMDAEDHENISEEEEEEEEAPDVDDDYCEQDYGSPEYWENRYSLLPGAFDWYQKWDAINNELNQLFTGDELVLNIGCGNSEMSAEMQKTTFQTVVSIDISGVVINQMIEKYNDNKDLIWFEMDCTNLTFEDEFFDIVFDKGTFDAILCGAHSLRNIYMSMSEIWRVLKYGGLFIEITYGQPSNRVDLFENAKLSWKLYEPIIINDHSDDGELDESEGNHYIYIFQKLLNCTDDSDNNEDDIKDDINNDDNNNNNNNNNDNDNSENKSDAQLESNDNGNSANNNNSNESDDINNSNNTEENGEKINYNNIDDLDSKERSIEEKKDGSNDIISGNDNS